MNRMAIEHTIPHELTSTGAWNTMPYNSQGIGKLQRYEKK